MQGCNGQTDNGVDMTVSLTEEGGRITRRRTLNVANPALPILKFALFIVLAIVLGGVIVFSYKGVRTLVDAGTRAVDDAVRAKEQEREIAALACDASPVSQVWVPSQAAPHVQGYSTTVYTNSYPDPSFWAAQ
ncbi:hypothetical protein pmac_cds_819 [Pandoravirus macleodensis]|uniref:Uncharacterized protein n=1 Tax=Pandoravirus macleodensis TaxID=2107707 RepID=A0A2U7UG95_9VIRU|nr:hypothetical protein pmac_cds_819 [Pandoravirus macleodensis]AVK77507.1 hypothetical protein pmac_cds_819 [Pandoravirus macleodensis]